MGTLQGLTREILEKHNIKPDKNDIGANFVLELDHDELAKIRSEKNAVAALIVAVVKTKQDENGNK